MNKGIILGGENCLSPLRKAELPTEITKDHLEIEFLAKGQRQAYLRVRHPQEAHSWGWPSLFDKGGT